MKAAVVSELLLSSNFYFSVNRNVVALFYNIFLLYNLLQLHQGSGLVSWIRKRRGCCGNSQRLWLMFWYFLFRMCVCVCLCNIYQVKFRDFVPSILNVSRKCLASGEEDVAILAFEIFDELIESPATLLGDSVKSIVQFSLEVSCNQTLEISTRHQVRINYSLFNWKKGFELWCYVSNLLTRQYK